MARSSDSEEWIKLGVAKEVELAEEGEIRMNEVLKLYKERKINEIEKKYNDMVLEEYNNLEEVKKYKSLTDNFMKEIEELVKEYNREDYKPFVGTGYAYDFKYEISEGLKKEIEEKYSEKRNAILKEIFDRVDEISAQLSLSDDKNYQVEILTRYGILDEGGFLASD